MIVYIIPGKDYLLITPSYLPFPSFFPLSPLPFPLSLPSFTPPTILHHSKGASNKVRLIHVDIKTATTVFLTSLHIYNTTTCTTVYVHAQHTYLIINSCNNDCPYLHADGKTAMEVLVEEERLYDGRHKEKYSIDVAMPVSHTLVLCEVNHQSV